MNIRTRQAGFSIIELMIAVALGLIVLAALTTFFVQTSANRTEMERNTRQIENGRYAIDTLRDDVSLAGFFADLAPGFTPDWQTPPACPANLAAYALAVVPSYTVPVPVFGYPLGVGAPAPCLQDLIPGNDILVIRRFGSEPFTPAQALLKADRWYLQNAQCQLDVDNFPTEPFVVAAGGGPFAKRTVACGVDYASVWRLREQVYYLRSCSVCLPASDGIPTLWRAELDPLGLDTMKHYPVVEGIEALRFDYGVDSTGDGQPDLWTREPADATAWSNVTVVKMFLIARNLEGSPNWVDNKTYNLGLWGDTVAVNDNIKRHAYSALIALPNRAGPRELPISAPPP